MLTLANLFCGCLALVEVLKNGYILGACLLMALALICDFLDGFLARLLKVSSPIGVQLDSLADMVTFGVLPAALYSWVLQQYTHIPAPYHLLAFVIAMFSCLRLAKFNIDTRQSDSFIGVPTPANAIFIAALALNIDQASMDFLTKLFENKGVALGFVAVSSYMLVAELPLFALKFKDFSWAGNSVKYVFLLASLVLLLLFKVVALPWIIIAYVLLSAAVFFLGKKA